MIIHNRKAWFLKALAEDEVLMDSQNIHQMMQQLEIRTDGIGYFCMAVRLTEEANISRKAELPIQLLDICQKAARLSPNNACCYLGSRLYCVVIMEDKGNKPEVITKFWDLMSRCCTEEIQLGIGATRKEQAKLSYSRVEAYEALDNIWSSEKIRYIEDVYSARTVTVGKGNREKQNIVEAYRSGDLAKMEQQLKQLAEQIRSETPVKSNLPYPTSIRRTVIELLAEIMHIAADEGVAVEETIGTIDPYRRVFELQDTPEIIRFLVEIAEKLSEKSKQCRSQVDNELIEQARTYIESHLDDVELSLASISDHLAITPGYFSALFIRKMGMGYKEYVNQLRIQKAKRYLWETKLSVNEISSCCGFLSPSYFISVFKNQAGMTPGAYRKLKN